MRSEVKKYCDSCNECQLAQTVKTSDRTPITPVVRPELPFQVVNIDLIGPIDPPSSKGHKYILCLVDQHTRTGIPNVIASDNGTNFIAEQTREFEKRIGSSPKFSTPGYPQSNGLVERFNRTLKYMLRNVVREEGKGWHLQISYVLWAYREIPHSTTGVSPFQLLYVFHEMKKGEKNGKSPYAEKISKQPIQPRFVQNILNRTALTKKNLEPPG
ncbi:unnamed protein product [Larinioides sclopetarius]|uniref:Integrase catalytic domain-containing protein n=1 Tax=Larinioides sclopetarius TaxID=280406 RepID=A0AAV2AZX0_9ARAC